VKRVITVIKVIRVITVLKVSKADAQVQIAILIKKQEGQAAFREAAQVLRKRLRERNREEAVKVTAIFLLPVLNLNSYMRE
jgi:hypothetical protein